MKIIKFVGLFWIGICFGLFFNFTLGTNYCDPSLCKNQGKHVGCGHSYTFATSCIKPSIIPISIDGQNYIVGTHNTLRNQIASGELSRFQGAVRMQAVQWNNELAKLAELNVMQCQMEHDHCHATDDFKWAGQNLGIFYTTSTHLNSNEIVTKLINEWFNEYRYATQADVDKIGNHRNRTEAIGHFTALVQDKTSRVGCAAATFLSQMKNRIWNSLLFACNYSYTNVVGTAAYKKGSPGSECTTGRNAKYLSLCNPKENVSSNPS